MKPPGPALVFHVCDSATALRASSAGHYRPVSLDSEGFIHLSQAHQVRGVIAAFYAGVPALAVLVVDPARLTAPLRFEPASSMPGAPGGAAEPATGLFPHLYGPLNAAAVVTVIDADKFDPLAYS